jgi:hypothetical protein
MHTHISIRICIEMCMCTLLNANLMVGVLGAHAPVKIRAFHLFLPCLPSSKLQPRACTGQRSHHERRPCPYQGCLKAEPWCVHRTPTLARALDARSGHTEPLGPGSTESTAPHRARPPLSEHGHGEVTLHTPGGSVWEKDRR